MTIEDQVKEEQSKRVFWVIQTVFSLLIAQSLVEYKATILDPFSQENYLITTGLILVYLTAVWSWIDYSFSTIVSPYDFGSGSYEKARFAVDLFIVICYAYLLFSLTDLQNNKNSNITSVFVCITIVFSLYALSGFLRILMYGRVASRIWLILRWLVMFTVISTTYSCLYSIYDDLENLNFCFLLIAIFSTIGYRVSRALMTHRSHWIAVDLDGVLANQIEQLLPIIKIKYMVDLQYDDITEWALPIADTDFAIIIREELKNKRFVMSMNPMDGAKSSMDTLIQKYKIAVVTARPPISDEWTKAWLKKNKISYDAYINSKEREKHTINVDNSVLIDDYLGNIEDHLNNSDESAILFRQPWNAEHGYLINYVNEGRMIAIRSWKEIPDAVDSLIKGRKTKI